MKNIHIGSLIKKRFDEKRKWDKHFNKTVFAELIHVHRSTIYVIFEQKSIDIELLIRISKALDYNFIEEIYLRKSQVESECKIIVGIELTKQQLEQLDFPESYFRLLKMNKK